MLSINNVATQDNFVPELTMESLRGGGKLVLLVANNPVLVRLRPFFDAASAGAQFGDEILVPPSTLDWTQISGVMLRSAIAGSPARVIAQLYEPGDVVGSTGNAFLQTLSSSGAVGGNVLPNKSAVLSGDIAVNAATPTYFDALSLDIEAGTWIVSGQIEFRGGANIECQAKLWDKVATTVYGSVQPQRIAGGNVTTVLVFSPKIITVTVTTTITMSVVVAALAGGEAIKAQTIQNPSGNTATYMSALQIG